MIREVAIAGIIGAGAFALIAASGAPDLPNARLTPGAIGTTSTAEICGRWVIDQNGQAILQQPGQHYAGERTLSYSRAHRVWHDKAGTLAKYGIPYSEGRRYEDDDLVPVCLGGDNADPSNHWPQPWAQARQKDHLEAAACRRVCEGKEKLTDAQRYFLSDAWAKDLR